MRITAGASAISLAVLASPTAKAFVSPSSLHAPRSTLLQEIATEENAEEVAEEAAAADAAAVAAAYSAAAVAADGESGHEISRERIDRAIKERPYPLFLAEKTASFLLDPFAPAKTPPPPFDAKPKESLVVLGTGWGAAALLKNIDTDKYDVTVISPRNYFVFTPMLAGASVGSVDFKSITEPIREVRSLDGAVIVTEIRACLCCS